MAYWLAMKCVNTVLNLCFNTSTLSYQEMYEEIGNILMQLIFFGMDCAWDFSAPSNRSVVRLLEVGKLTGVPCSLQKSCLSSVSEGGEDLDK